MAEPMVWLPPAVSPRRKGFRAFIEKHDALFTVVGALIVLGGVVMKDGVVEETKDLASTLVITKSAYAEQTSLASIMGELTEIRKDQAGPIDPEEKKQTNRQISATRNAVYRTYGSLLQRVGLITQKLQWTDDLMDKLPHKTDDLLKIRRDTHEMLDSFGKENDDTIYQSMKDFSESYSARGPDQPEPKSKIQERDTLLTTTLVDLTLVESDLDDVIVQMDKFKDQVLEEAEVSARAAEYHLKVVKRWSWLILGIGGGLSIVGKLLKIPALGGAGGD